MSAEKMKQFTREDGAQLFVDPSEVTAIWQAGGDKTCGTVIRIGRDTSITRAIMQIVTEPPAEVFAKLTVPDPRDARIAELEEALRSAVDRLDDILMRDDGQAFSEAERALPSIRSTLAGKVAS